jgi:AcrR family transcriptional regulator
MKLYARKDKFTHGATSSDLDRADPGADEDCLVIRIARQMATMKQIIKPESPIAPPASEANTSRSKKNGAERREQQRSIDTRLTIIKAALTEFAEKGFEAASIRSIAQRTELQHPLITYHFRTKEILWRSVAEHLFSEIRTIWDQNAPIDSSLPPRDFVREEFRILLRFMVEYKDFHQFMLRESRPNNPRLAWLTQTFLAPLVGRTLPKIRLAQESGDLPPGDPLLVNYMLIGITSALSSLGPEIQELSGIKPDDPAVVDAYWAVVDATVFGRKIYGR